MAQEVSQEKELKIGEKGRLQYDRVGMMRLVHPFVIDSKRIDVIFVYDLIERRFVSASNISHDSKEIVFDIQPNTHTLFELCCNNKECSLKVYDLHVHEEVKDVDGYEEIQSRSVEVNEVYSTSFCRDWFRSISNDRDTPDIIAFISAYLIPLDLPEVYFPFYYTSEIVEVLKKFFET